MSELPNISPQIFVLIFCGLIAVELKSESWGDVTILPTEPSQ